MRYGKTRCSEMPDTISIWTQIEGEGIAQWVKYFERGRGRCWKTGRWEWGGGTTLATAAEDDALSDPVGLPLVNERAGPLEEGGGGRGHVGHGADHLKEGRGEGGGMGGV